MGAKTELGEVLFPKRGLSATELLLAINLTVAAALLLTWGRDYGVNLRHGADVWWGAVRADHAYGWFLPTIFLHAGPGHLASNMIALLVASGAVEFLAGGGWTLAAYLVTGLGAAWVSYAGHGAPPLSIGASGAILGLFGCTVSFVIRRRRIFNYAQQWKVWRVYVPLFILILLPVLVNADVHAHVGGFGCGLVVGLLLPPHQRIRNLASVDSLRDE
ncbi:MAG: rhomboid family intramembrane serine protease [Candidatus Eisenbacteria bacterium]|uniref:Rhomboid family intramembrane serine protease n=1 Tax=Eiseniibacteriota bacterium TaxID=2212470 RepID=A0A538S8Z0_UNCEI|nr:MAG: rhomboid family intramembrane serine protease [Candidatus Eisenbacteria bacterium]TMQ58316.1 MAG: rhomboid family intramembrane serine protease [Candidatus Eisenbacteria bacterium]